jgi:hypothetical protein
LQLDFSLFLQPFLVGFLRIASLYFIFFFILKKSEFWGITKNWVMTLVVVYFHGRPAQAYSHWSIFTGNLPTHAHTSLFSWATCPSRKRKRVVSL